MRARSRVIGTRCSARRRVPAPGPRRRGGERLQVRLGGDASIAARRGHGRRLESLLAGDAPGGRTELRRRGDADGAR
ncbi:MAG: hypothetical protein U1F30_15500 [Steroidobacteraceae bacterium]